MELRNAERKKRTREEKKERKGMREAAVGPRRGFSRPSHPALHHIDVPCSDERAASSECLAS